jgi:subtilisin family serine protease
MVGVPLGRAAPADPEAHPLEILGVRDWHRAGHRGKGITVAILDSGWKGWRNALGKVLPGRVLAKSFREDGDLEARDSEHGVLCAEIIHTIAPEARLLLANWEPETPRAFLAAVRWAREQGARVISCSMIMPAWSDGEGNGVTHAELARLLGEEAVFIASAGNTATRHWGGAFTPDRRGWHQWKPGQVENLLHPVGENGVCVELVHGTDAVYDLVVVETGSGNEVGRTRSAGLGTRHASVRWFPQWGERYAVRLERVRGQGRFHLTVLGASLSLATAAGSIAFPGDGAKVLTVAAVTPQGKRLSYSSCGPVGEAPKPDFAARVPFAVRWRPAVPFGGTSAAAPQAAGLAALVWSVEPGLRASAVRQRLQQAAQSLSQEPDTEVGHGELRLPQILEKKKSTLDTPRPAR